MPDAENLAAAGAARGSATAPAKPLEANGTLARKQRDDRRFPHDDAIRRHELGESISSIARSYGVSPQAVRRIVVTPVRPINRVVAMTPFRVDDLLVTAVETDEGTYWFLEGRGKAVCSYSISAIDAEILRRFTPQERDELDARPNHSPSTSVRRRNIDPLMGGN